MSKKLSSGLAIILPNKKTNLFVIFLIILGIISGSIFLVVLNKTDKVLVINQINEFIKNIDSNNINNLKALKNSLYENGIFLILMWLFGMSIIGIIINVFLTYIRGFIIGFSLSSFFLVYKYKGLLYGLIYFIPGIINIGITLIIGVYSILFTIYLCKTIFGSNHDLHIKKFLRKYVIILGVCIVLTLISSLLEAYLVPALLKLVIKLF